jgi:hypothetical protein
MYKIFLLVLLLLTTPSFSTPCFGLDYLDEVNLIDNIIKSFDEEPQNWYFGTCYAVYAKSPTQLKKALDVIYPEHDPNSIIVIGFNLNRHGGSYITFDKPDLGFISEGSDKQFKKFDEAIKIQLYKKLQKQVGFKVQEKEKKPVILPEEKTESSPRKL